MQDIERYIIDDIDSDPSIESHGLVHNLPIWRSP